jgi:multicomponent Na+:H+ antiporter subunit D
VIEQHLSILLVVIPLLAAPITAILPWARIAWLLTLLVSWVCLLLAVWQLQIVLAGNIISYELGGWAPPWGIEYRIDIINAFIAMIVAAIAAITLPYALRSVEQEIVPRHIPLFYTAFLLCLTGLLGITLTGDIFNLFVFLEISSLSSYALISMGRQRQALTAAFQYLVMGTIGATFLLIGIGLTYAVTGTLNMSDITARLQDVEEFRTLHTAFAFIFIGIALKLAMFPLHLWLPNVYTYAPSVISVFLAATATKVAIYVLIRVIFTIYGIEFAFEEIHINWFLLPLSAIAVISASLVAIFQTNIKRMLAYSSVAQIGYILLGIGLASMTGLTAAILHLFNHALMKGALFMTLGAIFYKMNTVQLGDLNGIGRRMPLTMGAFVIGGLSLVGVPLTVGFISKWYLVVAALEQQWWWLVVILIVGSLLALIYIWRVVEVAYLKPAPAGCATRNEAPLSLLIPTWILIAGNIYFGIHTSLTVDVAESASTMLFGK